MTTTVTVENNIMASLEVRDLQGLALAGKLVLCTGIALSIAYPFFSHRLLHLLQVKLSSDNRISQDGFRQFTDLYYVAMAAIVLIGAGMIAGRKPAWRHNLKQLLLEEPLFHGVKTRPSPRFVLWASGIAGIFLMVHMKLYDPGSRVFAVLYKEDGIFESLTPIVMFAAACVLASVVYQARKTGAFRLGSWITLLYIGLTLFFVVYAGEEVSWGQRIFHWETPHYMAGNEQHETNIHNYFNDYFGSIYRLLSLLPLMIGLGAWLEFKRKRPDVARLALPHASMIILACLIATVSIVWHHEEEMLEEMCALFALFYSLRIHGCVQAAIRRKRAGRDTTI